VDNHNFIYAGGPDDNALNDGVKRYTASDAALAWLKTWYTPTGVLLKPTLAVHTTYDPIIPAESVRLYADQVQRAGSSANFVQQYVKHDGHCHISGRRQCQGARRVDPVEAHRGPPSRWSGQLLRNSVPEPGEVPARTAGIFCTHGKNFSASRRLAALTVEHPRHSLGLRRACYTDCAVIR
jgi:hypothetical protein